MKILEIQMQNFGSFFGEHTFKVSDRGLVFVKGDNQDEPQMTSNGAGKSTLFDAMDWCLFGKIPKKDHVDSVVNEQAGKGCQVTVRILDDGLGHLLITRGRAPKFEKVIWSDGSKVEDLTAMDDKVTQAIIEEKLGLDRNVFHAAVYRAQGDEFDFANATDAERKDLLSRIIPELAQVERLRDKTKELIQKADEETATLEQQIKEADHRLEVLQAKDWIAQANEWDDQRSKRLEEAEEILKASQHGRAHLEAQLLERGKVKIALDNLQPPPQSVGNKTAHEQQQLNVQNFSCALGEARAMANATRTELANLKKVGAGKCSRCKMVATEAHLQVERDLLETTLQDHAKLEQDAAYEHGAAVELLAQVKAQADTELANNQAAFVQYLQSKTKLEGQLQTLIQVEKQVTQLGRDIMRQEGLVESIQKEEWPGAAQRAKDEEEMSVIQSLLSQRRSDLDAWTHHKQKLAFWSAAFGLKGLQSFILDARLEDLTNAANEWVKHLTGGTYWVRFETQTMGRGGKLQEKFNVRVFRHNPDGTVTDRNYRSWSGGEKKRIALGIDWGLSCLVASRATKSWSEYIIDESFRQHIDSGGRAAIFELLERVQKDRTSVFVVDHDLEMAAHFENQVTVRIKNLRSVILEPGPKQAEEIAA